MESKISRVCWNQNNWVKPSGRLGKSNDKNSFEYQTGFGHEEWLFDTTKLIGGYHYAFLQTIAKSWDKYTGKKFRITLYTINSVTNEKWWIGKIHDAEVISKNDAVSIGRIYQKKGWYTEMYSQLQGVDARVTLSEVRNIVPCMRFKKESLYLPDEPIEIANPKETLGSFYYVLLNDSSSGKMPMAGRGGIRFRPGNRAKKGHSRRSYSTGNTEIELVHNDMVSSIYKQLASQYGAKAVGTEIDTGFGTAIDIAVRKSSKYDIYEVKTGNNLKVCVREALGQILEYALYPDANLALNMVLVSYHKPSENIRKYLKHLRSVLGVKLFYQQFDLDTMKLVGAWL